MSRWHFIQKFSTFPPSANPDIFLDNTSLVIEISNYTR